MVEDEIWIGKKKKKMEIEKITVELSKEELDALISATSGSTSCVISTFDSKDEKIPFEKAKESKCGAESFLETIKDGITEINIDEKGDFVFELSEKGKRVRKIIKGEEESD